MAQAARRTIFSRVSKEDPKHGRWILPLVVLALVAFTYTFVNNLPAAETRPTTTVAADTDTIQRFSVLSMGGPGGPVRVRRRRASDPETPN